jgi:hypothetical protein
MLDCQIADETQGSQNNEQVVEVKPLQEPQADHKATDEEDACRHCADIPGHLYTGEPISKLARGCGKLKR